MILPSAEPKRLDFVLLALFVQPGSFLLSLFFLSLSPSVCCCCSGLLLQRYSQVSCSNTAKRQSDSLLTEIVFLLRWRVVGGSSN